MEYNTPAMEPRIQYAKTSDGVSIAYWTLGEGMPLVHLPNTPFSHIELEWHTELRNWYQRLSDKRMVVRYDCRGSGLSERDTTDYSPDAQVLDLEAVVDRLGLERFALFGTVHSGPVAVTYAVRHPERVSHLILWCSYGRGSDFQRSPEVQSVRAMLDKDWRVYTETVAHVAMGWSEGEQAREFAAFMRQSVTQNTAQAVFDANREVDVSALLPQVRVPTLVLHRREVPFPNVDLARRLAAGIPDARLAVLEGTTALTSSGDTESLHDAIDEFLGEGEEAAAGAEPPEPGAFRTVLFTDVEGSTALTQRLGDAKARALLREHERVVRDALKAHGGSEVKTMGDGFMTSFSSAKRALECAIAMQRAFAEHNESAEEPIEVRVGVSAGEPIAEEDDLFGTAVIEASRITAAAKGGEILVAHVVRELTKGKDFLFADRGETSLRGFEDLVRLFEVSWRE